MLEFLPRPLYRRLYASGFPAFVARAGIAWRFVRRRSTAGDGYVLIDTGEDASRYYSIRATDLDSMIEAIEERFGPITPEREERARGALKRSIEKWDWYDDGRSDLEDNAIDRFIDWSEQAGDVLVEIEDEEAA